MKAFEEKYPEPVRTEMYTPPFHILMARENKKEGWREALKWAISEGKLVWVNEYSEQKLLIDGFALEQEIEK